MVQSPSYIIVSVSGHAQVCLKSLPEWSSETAGESSTGKVQSDPKQRSVITL